MQDEGGAVSGGLLQYGGGDGVVDEQRDVAGRGGEGGDVDQVEGGVGGCLDDDSAVSGRMAAATSSGRAQVTVVPSRPVARTWSVPP